jgi:hypothetical protein
VAIACDVAASTTINLRADTDLHQLTTSVAGERVHVTLGNEGGTFGFNPVWRLFGPDAEVVAGCDTFSGGDRLCVLPAVGAYAIEVQDSGFDATGTYSVQFQRVTAGVRCGGSLVCGVGSQSTVNLRADTDLWQFTGVAGSSVTVSLINRGGTFGFNPQWRLIGPDAAEITCASDGTCGLSANGSHAVEVWDGSFDATGSYTVTVSGPGCTTAQGDLVVSALSAPAKSGVGRTITVKVTTKNNGLQTMAATQTGLFLSPDNTFGNGNDLALGTPVPVPELAPGASSQAKRSVTVPGVAAGRYFVLAVADLGNTQPESNENNNVRAKAIAIGPDLAVSAISAPDSAPPGATISVTVTTKNKGGGSTGSGSRTRLYFSDNNRVDAADTTFVDVVIGVLGNGAANTTTVMLTVPSATPPGTRYLIGVADVNHDVPETNEGNNTKKKTITIQ